MQVLDDFLDRETFLAMRGALLAPSFPWEDSLVLSPSESAHLAPAENRQRVHGFFLDKQGVRIRSPHLGIVQPLLERLQPARLLKVKLNLTARRDRPIAWGLHVDTRHPGATTAVFYLNTNNGGTLFEDGTRVDSVGNRLVLFEASRRHTGVSCTDAAFRLVLNVNLLPAA